MGMDVNKEGVMVSVVVVSRVVSRAKNQAVRLVDSSKMVVTVVLIHNLAIHDCRSTL